MEDVDDELLALVGNGSASSRSASPNAPRKKRRREAEESDMEESDEDAEGSDEEEEEEELVNPFPVEGIYKDDADRERLLEMPELEREDELAARRDEITKRRQKADLAAMVRTQQDAGKKKSSKSISSKKPSRKLKRASAPKRTKMKRSGNGSDDDGRDDQAEAEDNGYGDEDDEEEEDEESDYERTTTRRGNRSRKVTGTSSKKEASLSKLKKRRVKAEKRRRGQDTDDESSEDEYSDDDEVAQEMLYRKAKEGEKRERDSQGIRREVKTSREEERIAMKRDYRLPELDDVNAARLRRDHFTRLVHRPDWISQLSGKFVRISMQLPDPNNPTKMTHVYRLAQISEASQKEKYYEVNEQYTNVYCTMLYGEEKMKGVPLNIISSSPILEAEYQRWMDRINQMSTNKMQRQVPSKEATMDMSEDLESFISRPYTEQDINEVLLIKKQAREAYMSSDRNKRAAAAKEAANAQKASPRKAGYDEQLMLEMNEKHRRADRERIAEAERRNAQKRGGGVHATVAAPISTSNPTSADNIAKGATAVTITTESGIAPKISSLSLAATDINIDLGDF